MSEQEYDYIFKILLIGNCNTGKASLMNIFAENNFDDGFVPTIGVDFVILNYIIYILLETSNDGNRWKKNKIANMGYCRPRTF